MGVIGLKGFGEFINIKKWFLYIKLNFVFL